MRWGHGSKLSEYDGFLRAKIEGAWTIPEDLFKETVDLEATLVVIIERTGKVYPSIPKELSEDRLEIGIRFTPD